MSFPSQTFNVLFTQRHQTLLQSQNHIKINKLWQLCSILFWVVMVPKVHVNGMLVKHFRCYEMVVLSLDGNYHQMEKHL
jgi:hypothetical protein